MKEREERRYKGPRNSIYYRRKFVKSGSIGVGFDCIFHVGLKRNPPIVGSLASIIAGFNWIQNVLIKDRHDFIFPFLIFFSLVCVSLTTMVIIMTMIIMLMNQFFPNEGACGNLGSRGYFCGPDIRRWSPSHQPVSHSSSPRLKGFLCTPSSNRLNLL